MKTKQLIMPLIAIGVLGAASGAKATITGSLWENSGGAYADVTPVGPADVTFSVANGPIDFDSRNASDGYTIGGWLATGGASIVTGTGEAGNTMDNTLVIMSGQVSVTSGETFTVEQDDGLVLNIGTDLVLNNPGPNSPTSYTGTYTGPSGNMPFTLEYAEIDGAPAVLDIQLPLTAVPEASTVIAGAFMLVPLGASTIRVLRSRKQTS